MSVPPPNPGKDHIVIVGASKTGTTGLYASVKAALAAAGIAARTMFEPRHAFRVDNIFRLAPGQPVLVKRTLDGLEGAVPDPLAFDRRIITVRDPRDVLVSTLLFRPLTKRALERVGEAEVEQFIAALEQKEADPASISVRELFELTETLGIGGPPYKQMMWDLTAQQGLMREQEFHPVRYERFIAGDLADLADYLGVAVTTVSNTESAMYGHIVRSKSSGAFRQWFRPDDLTYYNDLFRTHLTELGYPLDVELETGVRIDPAESSEYIRTHFAARRGKLATVERVARSAWSPTDVTTLEDLQNLMSFAADGDGEACVRVAKVALSGHLRERDEAMALRWARAAAQLGVGSGVRLTISLLTESGSTDPAVHRELRAWISELRLRDPKPNDQDLTSRLRRAEAELKQIKRSGGYRVGAQLAAVARDPRHRAAPAVKELARIWRGRHRR